MLIERPHSRYTREKTWAALYSQHIAASYALVPGSLTNNSLATIRCASPEEATTVMRDLLAHEEECRAFCDAWNASEFGERPATAELPILARAYIAVVLARSSDYYRYHLISYPDMRMVICGLHDSYLHLVVWETSTNKRWPPRETRLQITAPEFASRARMTPNGHSTFLGALICGEEAALALLADDKRIPERTARRIRAEVEILQHRRYQGRPLAFLTEAQRHAIGEKISAGLRAYHARWRA
jgi:hypothetical protein